MDYAAPLHGLHCVPARTIASHPSGLRTKKGSTFVEPFFSEPDRIRTYDRLLRREVLYPAELRALTHDILSVEAFYKNSTLYLSGWQDSNLRPPRPKRGAMTGLRYTPKP